MILLNQNIYRMGWVVGMNKQRLSFELTSAISQNLPAFKATRPESVATFEEFANAVDQQILKRLLRTKEVETEI